MTFLWNEKYNIGIEVIDKQHMVFLDLLNNAYDRYSNDLDRMISEDETMEVYGDILKLREYALNHFATEEKYMIKNKYPKFFDHKGEHDNFIKFIFELERKLIKERELTLRELIDFTIDWLKNHITRIDRQFGEYIKKRDAGLETT